MFVQFLRPWYINCLAKTCPIFNRYHGSVFIFFGTMDDDLSSVYAIKDRLPTKEEEADKYVKEHKLLELFVNLAKLVLFNRPGSNKRSPPDS